MSAIPEPVKRSVAYGMRIVCFTNLAPAHAAVCAGDTPGAIAPAAIISENPPLVCHAVTVPGAGGPSKNRP
jgi:hypothetical protein